MRNSPRDRGPVGQIVGLYFYLVGSCPRTGVLKSIYSTLIWYQIHIHFEQKSYEGELLSACTIFICSLYVHVGLCIETSSVFICKIL